MLAEPAWPSRPEPTGLGLAALGAPGCDGDSASWRLMDVTGSTLGISVGAGPETKRASAPVTPRLPQASDAPTAAMAGAGQMRQPLASAEAPDGPAAASSALGGSDQMRQLLARVEAEHDRQVHRLWSELRLAHEQLALAQQGLAEPVPPPVPMGSSKRLSTGSMEAWESAAEITPKNTHVASRHTADTILRAPSSQLVTLTSGHIQSIGPVTSGTWPSADEPSQYNLGMMVPGMLAAPHGAPPDLMVADSQMTPQPTIGTHASAPVGVLQTDRRTSMTTPDEISRFSSERHLKAADASEDCELPRKSKSPVGSASSLRDIAALYRRNDNRHPSESHRQPGAGHSRSESVSHDPTPFFGAEAGAPGGRLERSVSAPDAIAEGTCSSPRSLDNNVVALGSKIVTRVPGKEKERLAWRLGQQSNKNLVASTLERGANMLGLRQMMTRAHTKMAGIARDKDKHNRMLKCMNSSPVKFFCCLIIVVNACFIGASTHVELQAQVDGTTLSEDWTNFEIAFTMWFTTELALRIASEQVLFLYGEDRFWNAMDTFLVLSSLATLVADASAPTLTVGRLLRLFRFTRILRVLRVIRFMQNFRIMILAIIQSFGTLMWVFVVLFFFKFFFAMIFMQGATYYLEENGINSELTPQILELFGGLSTSLLSLFEAITGGRDWHEIVWVLLSIHWAYGLTFVVYIFFMVFLVLNVVVGGVVKTTSEVYKRDRQLIVEEEKTRLTRYSEEIKVFFREADKDGSGTLSWEEFYQYLHDDKVKAYFQTLELDISQAHVLFTLLDQDESDEVAIDEFVEGCMRLKGQARSIDVNLLLYEIEKTMVRVEQFAERVQDSWEVIEDHLTAASGQPRTPCGGGDKRPLGVPLRQNKRGMMNMRAASPSASTRRAAGEVFGEHPISPRPQR